MKNEIDKNTKQHPMVQWFNPLLLAKLGIEVIVSALFGKYADQRTIQAALDNVPADALAKRAKLRVKQKDETKKVLNPDKDGAVWIDYVADLGEGFNPTYAMASLLAQEELEVNGEKLPRGEILVMGGDEVYPTASQDAYKKRMRVPYELAFPDNEAKGAKKPRLYVIPGNHDWYDGLAAFTSVFLRFRDREPYHGGLRIGSWRCKQPRSYFALQLTDDCWLWGLDIQLDGYVDQPQVNYFRIMANELSDNARVILCTAQPSWLKAEKPGDKEYRSLNYIASLVDRKKNGNQKAFLMVAGDIHHYSRYSEEKSGMQFVTAGGGGAFLHPTHQLKETLDGDWLGERITLNLANDAKKPEKLSCYPDQDTSRSLLSDNWKFIFRNWDFCLALGIIYGVLANIINVGDVSTAFDPNTGSLWDSAIIIFKSTFSHTSSVLVALLIWLIMMKYADSSNKLLKRISGSVHAALQLMVLIGCTAFFQNLNAKHLSVIQHLCLPVNDFTHTLALFLQMIPVSFVLAGGIWGLYLTITCYVFSMHTNDGFSAMQIADYKNFLRIKIQKDKITIYPIGLNKTPKTEDWIENPDQVSNPSASTYVSKSGLQPHLIEAPIEIDTRTIKRLKSDGGDA